MNEEMIPEVRFEGFDSEWEELNLGKNSIIFAGGTPSTKIASYWEPKEVPWLSSGEVHKKYIYNTDNKISIKGLNNSSASWIKPNSVLIALAGQGKTRGTVAVNKIALTANQSIGAIEPNKKIHYKFLFNNLENRYEELRLMSTGDGGRGGLNNEIISKINIISPINIEEQKKVGSYFERLDKDIAFKQSEITKLKNFKQAMLQKMFPKEGEKEPEIRFEGFSGEWKEEKLGNILDYEQPTKYIVESDSYIDNQQIPVLTAGKSLLLGYTDETHGVYRADDKRGVIIFDDFTTSSHIINYDFKVKSSALKLLTTTSDKVDLHFVHELISSINYQPGNHERHWISIFTKFDVLIPSKEEQIAIGNFFKELDNKIELEKQNLEKMKQFKKAMLQKMFV